jgi:hypothetical protein
MLMDKHRNWSLLGWTLDNLQVPFSRQKMKVCHKDLYSGTPQDSRIIEAKELWVDLKFIYKISDPTFCELWAD